MSGFTPPPPIVPGGENFLSGDVDREALSVPTPMLLFVGVGVSALGGDLPFPFTGAPLLVIVSVCRDLKNFGGFFGEAAFRSLEGEGTLIFMGDTMELELEEPPFLIGVQPWVVLVLSLSLTFGAFPFPFVLTMLL
jgi:hypothetical protein